MTAIAILSLLLGMVLGQRFKVLALVPAIAATFAFAITVEIARAQSPWLIGISAALAIGCLQIGYLLGLGVRQLLAMSHASRIGTASVTGSLPARRPAH